MSNNNPNSENLNPRPIVNVDTRDLSRCGPTPCSILFESDYRDGISSWLGNHPTNLSPPFDCFYSFFDCFSVGKGGGVNNTLVAFDSNHPDCVVHALVLEIGAGNENPTFVRDDSGYIGYFRDGSIVWNK